jgi:hypothetical protein
MVKPQLADHDPVGGEHGSDERIGRAEAGP